jgi:Protein of unknown function (DUF2569)
MVLNDLLPLLSASQWEALTTPGSEAYRPALAGVLVFQAALNGLLVAYLLVTCVAFFQRRRYVPGLMLLFWGAQLPLLMLDAALAGWAGYETANAGPVALVTTALRSGIWFTYFQRSKRVKRTFLR